MSNKKCNVFTSNFGTLPLRFTLKDGELFVSKSDLTKIFYEFYPSDYRYIAEYFSQLNQSEDKEKSNNQPIGKILVVAFILFFIAYIFLFTKN